MTPRTFKKNKAGYIGVRNAFIGSILFAVIQAVQFEISSRSAAVTEPFRPQFSELVFVLCLGNLVATVPGFFGGKILEELGQKKTLGKRSLTLIGAALGILAAVLINLPEFLFSLAGAGHPVYTMYLSGFAIRLLEAVILAGLMGAWSGSQIAK